MKDDNSDDNKKKNLNQSIDEFNNQLASLASISTEIANSTFDLVSDKLSSQIDSFFQSSDNKDWLNNWNSEGGLNNGSSWNRHLGWRKGFNYEESMKKCEENKGINLWDQKGIWNCLLPKSQILTTNGKVVSVDSLQESVANKDAFLNFGDFLRWKKQVRRDHYNCKLRAIGSELQEKKTEFSNSLEEAKRDFSDSWNETTKPWSTRSDYGNNGKEFDNDNNDKTNLTIVGNSSQISIKSIDTDKFEKISKISNIYSDGSVDTKEYRTIIDNNGALIGDGGNRDTHTPHSLSSSSSSTIDELKQQSSDGLSSSSGWFWGGKGK